MTDSFFRPYKDRQVTMKMVVDVYKNLHTAGGYSIRCTKTGLVLAHCTAVTLENCIFHVSESGRQKTIDQNRKRVHAYVRGYLTGINQELDPTLDTVVYYNPYQTELFTKVVSGEFIMNSNKVHCEGKYCFI
ncbi:hypothetical protein [Bacillus cihuensis]|uniref:hypothetical protein n=1 Tax=Bacillus cihuensis TaxID=1208599 RepID=UPI0003FC09D9|nr:hypothetical protein [Bacillus cihuensis]